MANFVWINEKRGYSEIYRKIKIFRKFALTIEIFVKLPGKNRNCSEICLENQNFLPVSTTARPLRFQTRLTPLCLTIRPDSPGEPTACIRGGVSGKKSYSRGVLKGQEFS